jgi:hypothetical protein
MPTSVPGSSSIPLLPSTAGSHTAPSAGAVNSGRLSGGGVMSGSTNTAPVSTQFAAWHAQSQLALHAAQSATLASLGSSSATSNRIGSLPAPGSASAVVAAAAAALGAHTSTPVVAGAAPAGGGTLGLSASAADWARLKGQQSALATNSASKR